MVVSCVAVFRFLPHIAKVAKLNFEIFAKARGVVVDDGGSIAKGFQQRIDLWGASVTLCHVAATTTLTCTMRCSSVPVPLHMASR
jgi:hypothetical protein